MENKIKGNIEWPPKLTISGIFEKPTDCLEIPLNGNATLEAMITYYRKYQPKKLELVELKKALNKALKAYESEKGIVVEDIEK